LCIASDSAVGCSGSLVQVHPKLGQSRLPLSASFEEFPDWYWLMSNRGLLIGHTWGPRYFQGEDVLDCLAAEVLDFNESAAGIDFINLPGFPG